MKETVTLNGKEQKRLRVLNEVEMDRYTGKEAADMLDLSLRHVRRLLAVYRKEGVAALAHGNRGKKPPNAKDASLRKQVVELYQRKYVGFNTQHFTESLEEREGIQLSRSSVRNILLAVGIRSPRKRQAPKHRSRRERYPQEGMMLQIDASPHDWLEGRGPELTLIGAIDDATGKVPYAFFRKSEDAVGYFLLLRGIVTRYGIPLALYHDRDSVFVPASWEKESIEDQLEGKVSITQYGRLLNELGIQSIPAYSPQAKGRVERLWKTFQDRLISELRLAGAKTEDEANRVLSEYLIRHNDKFAVPALQSGSAYLKVTEGFDLDRYFCFKYQRVVGGDNVVRFEGTRLQILPSNGRQGYAHARVEVHVKLDGTISVFYQGNYLLTRPAPAEASLQRVLTESRRDSVNTLKTNSRGHKPAPDHPWKRPFKVPVT